MAKMTYEEWVKDLNRIKTSLGYGEDSLDSLFATMPYDTLEEVEIEEALKSTETPRDTTLYHNKVDEEALSLASLAKEHDEMVKGEKKLDI